MATMESEPKARADFEARDRTRRLLMRGLSHDYKRVLATLSRRCDEIYTSNTLNDRLSSLCLAEKSVIRQAASALDDIGNELDAKSHLAATAIVSSHRGRLKLLLEELKRFARAINIEDGQNSFLDFVTQADRADRQISALVDLPFNPENIQPSTVNIRREVDRIILDLYDIFATRGLSANEIVSNNSHSTIFTDRILFSICISNLITNAVVHSGRRDDLQIRIYELNSRDTFVPTHVDIAKIAIEDNGEGVEASDRGLIFQLFKQGRRNRDSSGSGVGLSFARHAAHMLGGELVLDHTFEQGARFVLQLPTRSR